MRKPKPSWPTWTANAVYEHLIDLMEVQRAGGRFDYFRSEAERDVFIRQLEAFFLEQGRSPRNQ